MSLVLNSQHYDMWLMQMLALSDEIYHINQEADII